MDKQNPTNQDDNSTQDQTQDQDTSYEIIKTIISHPYDPSSSTALLEKPLLIGCSGGGGHIAAIRALADFLQERSHTITLYTPATYKKKPNSWMGISLSISLYLSSRAKFFDSSIKNITQRLNLPTLPDDATLSKAIAELHSSVPRPFIDMLLDVSSLGFQSAAMWNIFQREDKKEELTKLITLQPKSDALNYDDTYQYFLNLLTTAHQKNAPYSEIISTQALGLPALCDAVIAYNNQLKTNSLYSERKHFDIKLILKNSDKKFP